MSKPAAIIAGEILKRAKDKNIRGISNMSLQKLLFIANGLYTAKEGEPLISEPVEVWQYGPVINSVYHEFKGCGNSDIQTMPLLYSLTPNKELDKTAEQAIDFALKVAENLNAIQLSNWSHQPESPWTKAKENGETVISKELLKDYFKKFIK